MNFSRIVQLFLGMIIGLSLIGGGAAATGYYFLSRLTEDPPRPVFAEETAQEETEAEASSEPSESDTEATETPPEDAEAAPEPSSEPEEDPDELKGNEYRATVTWPEGLSLRDSPGANAERIGGIAYNKEMIVMEESEDGDWQKVRLPGSGQEGWVKAGNAERVE